LWEVLYNEDIGEHGREAEELVAELTSAASLKTKAEVHGLTNVKLETSTEIFEFENGAEFVASPLVDGFLLPHWIESLDENEKEQVKEKLAQLIDAEDGDLTFRFTVKATVITGKKT
jgi:hypothetical protein